MNIKTKILLLASGLVIITAAITAVTYLSRPIPVPEPEPIPEPIVEPAPEPVFKEEVIGASVEGREIVAYTFGLGDTNILFVGGMHGGYEWNSSLLAYEMIDYFASNTEAIPRNLKVTVIPDLNPDGTFLVTNKIGRFSIDNIADPDTRVAAGRFNANEVDLNRNFDCKWAPESTWRGNVVSAGDEAFSEPEAAALRDFVQAQNPAAAIFWHSQANNVYASECEEGVIPETLALMSTYAQAADYGEVPVFDAYPITGDAEGWLATLNIPAVTVELESFNDIEWSRNLAGTLATLELYADEDLAR